MTIIGFLFHYFTNSGTENTLNKLSHKNIHVMIYSRHILNIIVLLLKTSLKSAIFLWVIFWTISILFRSNIR